MGGLDDEIRVVVLQEPMVLFRGCHGRSQPDLIEALTSNYEAGRSPHPVDLRATVLHMAVSMYEESARADLVRMARRRPDRIGTHIARVELQPDRGFCIAKTGARGHWSVWGIPAQLAASVVDVEEVRAS